MKPRGVAGVSKVVKSIAVVALIGAAVLVWYLRRGHDAAPAAAAPIAAGSAAPTGGSPTTPRAPAHVKRVTAEERKQLAARIEKAREGRAATSAPARPSLPAAPAPSLPEQPGLSTDDPEQFKTTMKAAMKEVVPYLAECYDQHAKTVPDEVKVVAKLTLLGDPDVGTLIDTDGIADGSDAPLPSDFDLCLRDSLAGLQLPPLAEGEEVKVTYPFLFTR